jgi:bis(5'-nucleosyl)-tetraphosphatase (symmetrical)
MATYAIGDIQGCHAELLRLLEKIQFDPAIDKLWLVGDLVNRGPDSVGVLRLLRSLGEAVIVVLGNHDLHLLAVAEGVVKSHHSDTFHDVLNAPDRFELLTWLRAQRLLYIKDNFVLVHAGLLPSWTVLQAQRLAHEVEAKLRDSHYQDFLAHIYGNDPTHWSDDLSGYDRLRVIVNACTRMRVCTLRGEMEFGFKDGAHDAPDGYMPWFDVPGRASVNATVVCGHWSALGLKITPQIIALDSGCVWRGKLSAVRLEDCELFQVSHSIVRIN